MALALFASVTGCSSQVGDGEAASSGAETGLVEDDEAGGTSGSTGDPSGETEGGDDDGSDTDSDTDSGDTDTGEPNTGEPPVLEVDFSESACADTPVEVALAVPDTGSLTSAVHARDIVLNDGSLMDVDIRPWEFLNYYTFDYPSAEPGAVSVVPELIVDPVLPDTLHLQVNVSTEARTNAERPPLNAAFVLDTSGSMSGEPMLLMQESVRAIAKNLRPGDTVSIVEWDAESPLLSGHLVDGANDPAILDVIDGLAPEGGSDLLGGLGQAYDLLQASAHPSAQNRLFLVSDGSTENDAAVLQLLDAQVESGVELIGIGVGRAAAFDDQLTTMVSDVAGGTSVFIGDTDEAWQVFGDDFVKTVDTAVENLAIDVELPAGLRFTGSSQEAGHQDVGLARDLAPNNTLVVRRAVEACTAGELPGEELLTVRVRYFDPQAGEEKAQEVSLPVADLLNQLSPQALKATAVVSYAQALELWSDPWQWSIEQREASRLQAVDRLAAARELLPADPELAELATVLEALVQ